MSTSTTEPTAGAYDPGSYTVAEVTEYLQGADPAEQQRVLELERDGRARTGILSLTGATDAEPVPTTTVTLRHHWTDAEGTAHAPGQEVSVPQYVADQLVASRYAKAPEGEADAS